ncbi:MAG: hypothetical protein ACYDBB_01655 [Armatimonadota bacterium]
MTTLLVDQMTVRRDGQRITVHIPMALKVRAGRKEIILPDGLAPDDSPARKPATQESLVIALARAHRWKALLENGRFSSLEEMAHAVKLDRSYVGRILRLTLLAPDIIMTILDGKEPSGLSLGKLTKTLPLDWVEQRNLLGFPAM